MPPLSKTEHEEAVMRIMSVSTQQQLAAKQGLRAGLWSEDEVKLLKELYGKKDAQYIADKLGRPLGSVTRKACNIGITRTFIAWSSQERNLLKKLYGKEKVEDIAKRIGRSVSATCCRPTVKCWTSWTSRGPS